EGAAAAGRRETGRGGVALRRDESAPSLCQLEADAPYGFDIALGARSLQLRADVADMRVHGFLLHHRLLAPRRGEQLALGEHPARTAHEGAHKVELSAREAHG